MQGKSIKKLVIAIIICVVVFIATFLGLWFMVISSQNGDADAALSPSHTTDTSTISSLITSSRPYTLSYSSSYGWTYYSGWARSANQGVSSSTSSFTITYAATQTSNISFSYKVSSESNYDKFDVTVNGSTPSGWSVKSGTVSETTFTCSASPSSGNVVIVFSFTKDGSVNTGDDCAYVRNIVITGGGISGSTTLTPVISSNYSVSVTNPYTGTYSSAYSWVYVSDGAYIVPTNQGVASSYSSFAMTYTAGVATDVTISYKCSSESASYDYLTASVNGSTPTGWTNKGGQETSYSTTTFTVSATSQVRIELTYRKDGSQDKGDDCVYINGITIEASKYKVIYDESGFVNKVGVLVGGFENTGWAGGSFDTTHVRSGSYAYKITGSASVSEVLVYTSSSITLDSNNKNHIFYAQYWGYQETSPGTQSTQIYWPEEEPSLGQVVLGPVGQWNMYSYRRDRSQNALNGTKQLRIDFDNRNQNSEFWVDDFLLLDLTELFGAGNEPSKAWCDANIRTGVSIQEIEMNVATKLTTRTSTNAIAGHIFKGWTSTARTTTTGWPAVQYTDGQTVTDIAAPGETIVLYPVWELGTFTVTLDNQSATSAGSTSVTATYGEAMPTITLPKRTGYTFGGYYTQANGAGTQYYTASGASARAYDQAKAITLYAKWTINQYTLTANANGGTVPTTSGWTVASGGVSATKSITYNTKVGALPTPTKSGYTFGGWYLDLISMGYTPVEYIQSSSAGGECINTGYAWTHENIRIICDAYASSTGSGESLFGTEENTASSGSNRWFGGIPHGGSGYYSMYVGEGSRGMVSVGTASRFVMEVTTTSEKKLTVKVNGQSKLATSYTGSVMTSKARNQYDSSFVASGGYGQFYIFSNHNSNRTTTNYAGTQFAKSLSIYSFKMYDNDVLVRDYIPVKNASGVAGLFDLVNCEFVTTSSGTFAAGHATAEKIMYQKTAVTDQTDYTAEQNLVVYAKWTQNSYTVTANANGGTISADNGWTKSSDSKTATKSLEYYSNYGTMPTPSRTGYTFDGWYLDLSKSGYTLLQYIESSADGGEYINTNYYWRTENVRIVADLMAQGAGSNQSLFGSEEYVSASGDARWFGCVAHGGEGTYSLYMGNSYSTGAISIGKTARNVIDISAIDGNTYTTMINGEFAKGRTYFTDSIRSAYAVTNYQPNVSPSGSYGLIYIFSNHNSNRNNADYSPKQFARSMRLYSFQMWDNDALVRYFVPVKNSSGVAGLYDLVEDKFYTTPSGAFIAGPTGAYRLTDGNVISSAANHTIYAGWSLNTYTVAYDANGGSGTMENSTHTYSVAKKLNKNTFTHAGYQFAGWSTSSTADTANYTDEQSVLNLTNDGDVTITLYAVWKILYKITLQANIAEALGLMDGGGIYVVGSQVTLSAYAKGEYILLYWLRDGNAFAGNNTNSINITVDGVHTYTAVFGEAGDEITDITVTTRLNGDTQVGNIGIAYVIKLTIDDVVYAHFYAEPQPGYRFKYWLLSDSGGTTYTDDVINLPVSDVKGLVVTAVFEPVDSSNINTELDNSD